MQQVVVDIADLKVSNDPDVELVTYSLGSCIGVAVWDPYVQVGGLLHYMLPNSVVKPKANPAMFADSGIPLLFHSAFGLGAVKSRMLVKIAGGASLFQTSDAMDIGRHNYVMLRKILWRAGVLIEAEHVGGALSRTMRLNIGTGRVTVESARIGRIVLERVPAMVS